MHNTSSLLCSNGLLGALLLGSSLAGCSDPGLPGDGSDSEKFAGASTRTGRLDLELSEAQVDDEHSGVLAILSVTDDFIELCTGTLIAPNLVLTARHCVAAAPTPVVDCDSVLFGDPLPLDSLWVHRSDELRGPLYSFGLLGLFGRSDPDFFQVAEVFVPSTGGSVCDGDVALLILDGQFDPDEATPIEPRLDEPVLLGETYAAVGFGSTPTIEERGLRRLREGLQVACGPDECPASPQRGAADFVGDEGVCSGDSGGPALAADGRVFGVASRASDCQSSVYSAIGPFRDWIREVAAHAAEVGDYPDADWLERSDVNVPPAVPSLDRPAPTAAAAEFPPPALAAAPPTAADPSSGTHIGSGACALSLAIRPHRERPNGVASLLLLLGFAAARRSSGRQSRRQSATTPPSLTLDERPVHDFSPPLPCRRADVQRAAICLFVLDQLVRQRYPFHGRHRRVGARGQQRDA